MRSTILSTILLLAIASLLLPLFPIVEGGDEGILQPVEPRPPTITISLHQDEIEIQTGPGHTGSTVTTGTITVEKPQEARTQIVYLDLYFKTFTEEMVGSVFPNIMEIPANENNMEYPIQINLQVSPMISTIDIDGTFEVYGEWHYKTYDTSGAIAPVRGNVILKPYYYFIGIVNNKDELKRVPIGSWVTAEFSVVNNGNDRVTIQIIEVTENQTLDCEIGTTSVTLNEGESKVVPIRLRKKTGPVGEAIYEQKIRLEASVDGELYTFDTSIDLKTTYTPGSFLGSIWFKLSIAGIIIIAVLITILVVRKRRRSSNNI